MTTYDTDAGRSDMQRFEQEQPDNFWLADPHIQRVIARWAGEDKLDSWGAQLEMFGAECAGMIDAAIRQNNLNENLPRLDRFSPYGERLEEVAHHPSFHLAGNAIYGSGMMTSIGMRGGNTRALVNFYLSSQNGEGGHNCPLACTAGVIKSLRELGSDELKERYLPRLLSNDYSNLAHGAQFLTEIQGGSDVGSNSVRAELEDEEEGTWRLFGEKWFCSNVTGDLVMVTARPDNTRLGTPGLGLFLMPRRLPDGALNDFTIRRLKDKVGTRTLPTAEIDLHGAKAWQVGPVENGFRNMMNLVINTSRIFNATGCSGIARRACTVAHGYARFRGAFGAPIIKYPMIQDTLADMRTETAAMVSGTFYLVHLADKQELGEANHEEQAFLRVGLNLNKTRTALSSHEVVVSGLEILGGNGTIETFSVIPRLLRDNVVFENWEGSHNVLFLQALRDCQRKKLHEHFFAHLGKQAEGHERLIAEIANTARAFDELLACDEAVATLRIREVGCQMSWLQWASAMHQDGTDPLLIDHFLDRRVGPAAPRDQAYAERIAKLCEEP